MLAAIKDDESLSRAQIADKALFGIGKLQVDSDRGSNGADDLPSVSHSRKIDEEDRGRESLPARRARLQSDVVLPTPPAPRTVINRSVWNRALISSTAASRPIIRPSVGAGLKTSRMCCPGRFCYLARDRSGKAITPTLHICDVSVAELPFAQGPAQGRQMDPKVPSSTVTPGHTLAIRSPLLTISPGRSSSARRISKALPPSGTTSSAFFSERSVTFSSNEPNRILTGLGEPTCSADMTGSVATSRIERLVGLTQIPQSNQVVINTLTSTNLSAHCPGDVIAPVRAV